jgi:hypothetical protein
MADVLLPLELTAHYRALADRYRSLAELAPTREVAREYYQRALDYEQRAEAAEESAVRQDGAMAAGAPPGRRRDKAADLPSGKGHGLRRGTARHQPPRGG